MKESLALTDIFQRVQMLDYKFSQLLFTSRERPVERAGTKLQTGADPLVAFALESEGQGDIAHYSGRNGTLLTALRDVQGKRAPPVSLCEATGAIPRLSIKSIGRVVDYYDTMFDTLSVSIGNTVVKGYTFHATLLTQTRELVARACAWSTMTESMA